MKKTNFIYIALLLAGCSNASPLESNAITEEKTIVLEIEDEESDQTKLDLETIQTNSVVIVQKSDPILTENKIEPKTKVNPSEIQTESFHNYIQWSAFLTQHVSSSGKVNYTKIKSDAKQLNAIILSFEKNYPSSSWSSKQRLAYWINAYNLYTLKLVSDHYPTSSITKITAKPWDKKFISLGGETLSLNDIEHKKIRAKNNEPRIHFALNCASESCPMLYNKAFTAKNLSYQLTKQTKRFLADKSKNDFSDSNNVKISSIFDWYKGDFVKKEGSVVSFINKYRTEQLSDPKISYLEYLWGLND